MKRFRFVPVACLVLLAGCMNANAGRGSDITRAWEGEVTVEFSVENAQGGAARTFTQGETVRFVFVVKNPLDRAQQLAYTFPPHHVEVFSGNNEPVWQAWQGQMFPQVMRNATLPAKGSETFSVEWQIDEERISGSYRAEPTFHGFVDGEKLPAQISPIDITIE